MSEKIISSVIEEYNKFRSPEATAKCIEFKGKKILIEFNGPFCTSCGVLDYFEDFIIEAERKNFKLTLNRIKQLDFDSYLIEFRIKR